MNLRQAVEGVGEAAFVVDQQQHIVQWNQAARVLLGHSSDDVIGRPCHAVLAGKDAYGNTVCSAGCATARMVRCREPVHAFDVTVRAAGGAAVSGRMAIVPLVGFRDGHRYILHLLLAHPPGEDTQRAPRLTLSSTAPGFGDVSSLTRREIQVLKHLASSEGTAHLASSLGVSAATVRTHIRNILRKLEAHSRLEAVVIGLRSGWI